MPVHLTVIMPVYNERYLVEESIRRVLAVDSPNLSRVDLVVVDDGSTDGTRELLRVLADKHRDRITYAEHPRNQGKGAAVRTGIGLARGDVTVIHDADLEYSPADFERLCVPFEREAADAVFGSRFLTADYRRVLYFRHTLGNRLLTLLCDLFTDLNLTDMETCAKAVRTRLLQALPLVSNDFRIEPELTIKLARREARIFEVPISYAGRTYAEGKKIGVRDGLLAVLAMLRFRLEPEPLPPVRAGDGLAHALVELSALRGFNRWMADAIRPYAGHRVLEVGAGLGALTRELVPRVAYTATDVEPAYLDALRRLCAGRSYLRVCGLDVTHSDDLYDHLGAYDTVLCLNVLEHLEDHDAAVRNMASALDSDGRLIVLVPQGPALYGSLDAAVGHQRRYTRETLSAVIERNGLAIERLFDFNRATAPGWWWNGRVLRRRSFGRLQLRLVNRLVPLFRGLERVLPWPGTSLIAVARRAD